MRDVRHLQIAHCPPEHVERLQRALGVSDPVAQVLVRRGLAEPAAAHAFLTADEEHPASAFAGIERAVALLMEHVHRGERITIHGDYDVDGICSTAILVRVLRALGAQVDWYLPDRATDGYGLNAATVERLATRGTQLLLTADCAITAVEEIDLARRLGMRAIVTDHHAPRADGRLPQAPIVHPRVCGYPGELCATAVAYKLAQALWQAAGRRGSRDAESARGAYRPEDDLDLVALATVADVVPLVGENRTLVRRGLRALASTAKPGLRALMSVAGVDPSRVNERALGFALAPRLNAVGRLYRADVGLELILTEDSARALQIARDLDRANQERRHTETRILFEATDQIGRLTAAAGEPAADMTAGGAVPAQAAAGEPAAYVLAGEGWHPGVIGIVASRLAERHHRPVVMVALEGEEGRGSGRSIEGFDLLAGLNACAAHLTRHGGHRAAAGLQLQRARLDDFRAAFTAHAQRTLRPEQLQRSERVDAVLDVRDLGMTLAEELQALAPFGAANPNVSLLVRGALLADRRAMGEGRHVRFALHAADGARAGAVAFGNGGRLPVAEDVPADVVFTLEVNEWKGVSEPRVVLRHAQAAESVVPAAKSVAPAASPSILGGQWQLPGIEDLLQAQGSASSM